MQRPLRILIVRLSAVGDCILTLPLLCSLRRNFPDARIVWATQSGPGSLLRDHDALDDLLLVPRGWLRSPATAWRLRRSLRALRPDWVLDPQGLIKSAALAWLSGSGQRVGFAAPEGREGSTWLNNRLVPPRAAHLVDKQLELLGGLGVPPGPVEFRLPTYAEEAAELQRKWPLAGQRQAFAVVNPGASWPSKRWPVERFAEVAFYLGRAHTLPTVVVWGNAEERRDASAVVERAAPHAVLAPPTSLRELACVLRAARLMISADSGPLHLAAAVGTTCVGLYGPTRPAHCGPYGAWHLALQAYYQDGTSRERRQADNQAMRAISVQLVCRACDQLLAGRRESTAA